jgi:hypothetical protein
MAQIHRFFIPFIFLLPFSTKNVFIKGTCIPIFPLDFMNIDVIKNAQNVENMQNIFFLKRNLEKQRQGKFTQQ